MFINNFSWFGIFCVSPFYSLLTSKKIKGKDDEIMEHSIEYLKSYCGSSEDHNFEDYVAEKEYLASKAGEKIGKKEGIIETAKKFLKMGLPLEKISEGTGLSQKEVESLKEEL